MRERTRALRIGEPFADKYPRLLGELEECFSAGEQLTEAIRSRLGTLSHGGAE